MAFYCDYIFPLLNGRSDPGVVRDARRTVVAQANGAVLEIGFGTGKTLPFYSERVTELTIVEPSESMNRRVQRALRGAEFKVNLTTLAAETLPFDGATFDTIVTTKTLCSVVDIDMTLKELHRVLKPTGCLLFLEHVKSSNTSIANWQRRLNPIQNKVGCGCNLDRDILRSIEEAGFEFSSLQRLEGGLDQPGMRFMPMVFGEALPVGVGLDFSKADIQPRRSV